MKAIPLWQPYASLVATGHKRIETRHFPPSKFGIRNGDRIAIYATIGTGPGGKRAYRAELLNFWHLLAPAYGVRGAQAIQHGVLALEAKLPRGQLIAVCTFALATQMTAEYVRRMALLDPTEHACGNYKAGRWAWHLTNVMRFPSPVDPPPGGSRQGAFKVPAHRLPCV